MNKRIAVLMTCYNRVNTTLECLRRLFAQGVPEGYLLDVWLVDDASPDKTGEKVKSAYPQVNVIQGTGSLFWCRGMHLAWSVALQHGDTCGWRYDFFIWLNDDVQLKSNAIADMLLDYKRHGGVIVGKFSSDANESDISYGLKGGQYASGNFVLVPKEVVEKIGIICGKYHHQYGDYDYGLHVKKAGFALSPTRGFSGVCPQQPERYKHFADCSLYQRIRLLWDPRGYDLHDAILYKYRNWGFIRAVLSAGHIIIKAICG